MGRRGPVLAAVAAVFVVAAAPAEARRASSPSVAIRDTSAAGVLAQGRLRIRISGTPGRRLRLIGTAIGAGRGGHSLTLTKAVKVTLSRGGRAKASLPLTTGGRAPLRAAVALCRNQKVSVKAVASHERALATTTLRGGHGCHQIPQHITSPPGTPPPKGSQVAHFQVGAATVDFTPPLRGAVPSDLHDNMSDCAPPPPTPGDQEGPRPFAYMEPYRDTNHLAPDDPTAIPPNPPQMVPINGHYDLGEPYSDCNNNGRWDGNFIGGGGGGTRYATGVADSTEARAFVVSNGSNTIAVEVVDQEGLFNTYQDLIRQRVRADGLNLRDDQMFLSATHDESAPQSLGLNGASDVTSATNDYWLFDELIPRAAKAIEQAYANRRPATIKYAEGQEPPNFRQCWSSYPYVDDMRMPLLQAVGNDGKPIVTLADVSQHTETLGFNPSSLPEWRKYSADWPVFFRRSLEQRYGGVAIEMAGSVGSVESPQVFPGPISQTPQRWESADHPAGCRTVFAPNGNHVPLGYQLETRAYGEQLAQSVESTLASSAVPSISNDVSGKHADICVEVANKLFAAAAAAGVFAHRSSYTNNCTVESKPAPNGSTSGTEAKGSVAAFRIGDGSFISVPGEVFPFTYLRSFMGPNDMPFSQYGLPTWLIPHMHTPWRFINGLGDDMLGYIFPKGNGVGVPGEDPNNPSADSGDRFGCGHSDDSEAASSDVGNIAGDAIAKLLDAGGKKPETILVGRYVMPDGTLSRDPLGGPEQKCNVDNVFKAAGPAVAVDVTGRGIIHPAAWMNSHGRPQSSPDRNTRGVFEANGTPIWVDVFPDVAKLP